MTTTTRGMQTSYGTAKEARKAARREVQRASVAIPDAAVGGVRPLTGAARFLAPPGHRFFRVKIAQLPGGVDPADDARTAACVEALGVPYVQFADGAYVTKNPAVIDWLRGRIARRRLAGVAEDLSMLDLPCAVAGCPRTFKNTEEGMRERYEHEFADHRRHAGGAEE